eukprot:TRINITY_DN11022_c0_g1_i1.p1 TRINITY_DN11022_c0_g1~~TRINITY_DN11022_c0_g1_i1.p1  ORF type:complete len:608 (+),score=116.51 TRINITY_DN11022_c0_g1_i1:254-1825(+)
MEKGVLTSEKIMRAYCLRAKQVGALTNAVTEEFYDEAIIQAQESDLRRRNGEMPGLLEGLPISLKDQIDQKGADSTCGNSARCYNPATKDGLLVKLIRSEGGIPFVRSNAPQSLNMPETDNVVYGRASNPRDPTRSPGGSSGGEGALVSSGASVLGVGTDIGGSIRIPSHFCGITSFKPTNQRVTRAGISVPFTRPYSGQEGILSVAGPMGRCVDDLLLMLKTWWDTTEHSPSQVKEDPSVAPIEFRQSIYDEIASGERKLRIGYFDDDGWFEPAPSCKRAVREVKEALEAQGHTLVPFKPYNAYELVDIYLTLIGADGRMRNARNALQGETLHPNYWGAFFLSCLPRFFRSMLSSLLKSVKQDRFSLLVGLGRELSTIEYQTYISRKNVFVTKFMQAWNSESLDAIISPGGSLPAFKHGSCKVLSASLSYYFVYNILHCPAGIVPVTTVADDEQVYPDPIEKTHRDGMVIEAKKVMEGSAGMPISIQVASMPFADEECLGVMKLVQNMFPALDISTKIPVAE